MLFAASRTSLRINFHSHTRRGNGDAGTRKDLKIKLEHGESVRLPGQLFPDHQAIPAKNVALIDNPE